MNKIRLMSARAWRLCVTALLLFVVSVAANAYENKNTYDFYEDGIFCNITSSASRTCAVTEGSFCYVDLIYGDMYDVRYYGDVIIPETVVYNGITYTVTAIGDRAFKDCSDLTSVTIPKSVTEIGSYAFENCNGLTSIYSLNPEPPTCGNSVFSSSITRTCILYVPEGSLGTYANASTWKDFYNINDNLPNAIEEVLYNNNAKAIGYYTLDGKMIGAPQKGVNIRRYSDGTARMVLVK